ncbi:MAG: ThiF family adenylyltransferase [Candidatus Delongbacteria bacterium]|nr:ThiF family adenylyltransferase [Candidatus Delongbacteria bacterium]
MSQQLINLNPDLKQLRDEGYYIEIKDGYLLLHDVPYLNKDKIVLTGTIVSQLVFAGGNLVKPKDHVAYFIGGPPCDKNGIMLNSLINNTAKKKLTVTLETDCMFSSKPAGGYKNYYDKMITYLNIILTHTKSIDPNATAKTFKVIEEKDEQSIFRYFDTNSSRADILGVSTKLENQKIAIVGLGGTGSYILDFLTKTPVTELHLFDEDKFLNHNAFRSPGAPSIEDLEKQPSKVSYFSGIYIKMRKNIIAHEYFIDEKNLNELKGFNFVFLCIDNSKSKKEIIEFLHSENINFIDCGMGLSLVDDVIIGSLRVTLSSSNKKDHVFERINTCDTDEDEAYQSNIQIAELNALNAALAVIKWKKKCGFYQDIEKEFNIVYSLNVNQLISSDYEA